MRRYLVFIRLSFSLSLLLISLAGRAQVTSALPKGYLRWRTTRRLQADDFQLRLRRHNNLTESVGNMGLEVNGRTYDLLSKKANQVVQNVFNTKGSYLDSASAERVALQIRYLQTLWDINEVAARRLRQELRANAKRMIMVGKPDMNNLIRTAYEHAHQRQIQYADETKYGLFTDRQMAWEQKLAEELAALAEFAVPD